MHTRVEASLCARCGDGIGTAAEELIKGRRARLCTCGPHYRMTWLMSSESTRSKTRRCFFGHRVSRPCTRHPFHDRTTNSMNTQSASNENDTRISPDDLLKLFESSNLEKVYVVGCYSKRLTVLSQQVRGMNLGWALSATHAKAHPGTRLNVGIVGGGMAGLACAASLLRLGHEVTLFERQPVLLHLFSGCTTRWIHPHIYDWPTNTIPPEDRSPAETPVKSEASKIVPLEPYSDHAALPILSWRAAKANLVTDEVLAGWKQIAAAHRDRLLVFLRAEVASISSRADARFLRVEGLGVFRFDAIVAAVGYGIEREIENIAFRSYWTVDPVDQYDLTYVGDRRRVLVSGTGDGGLTDFIRARLREFDHQETFLRLMKTIEADGDLITKLSNLEERLGKGTGGMRHHELAVQYRELVRARLKKDGSAFLSTLRERLRPDTDVVLNGPEPVPFSANSSMLNRLLTIAILDVDLEHATFTPGRLGKVEVSASAGRRRIALSIDDQRFSFDEVIVRHGARASIERIEPVPAANARAGIEPMSDLTRALQPAARAALEHGSSSKGPTMVGFDGLPEVLRRPLVTLASQFDGGRVPYWALRALFEEASPIDRDPEGTYALDIEVGAALPSDWRKMSSSQRILLLLRDLAARRDAAPEVSTQDDVGFLLDDDAVLFQLPPIDPPPTSPLTKLLFKKAALRAEASVPVTRSDFERLYGAIHVALRHRDLQKAHELFFKNVRGDEHRSVYEYNLYERERRVLTAAIEAPPKDGIPDRLLRRIRGDFANSLGFILRADCMLDEATQYFGKAIEERSAIDDSRNVAVAQCNLAECHLLRSEYTHALKMIKEADSLGTNYVDEPMKQYIRGTRARFVLRVDGNPNELVRFVLPNALAMSRYCVLTNNLTIAWTYLYLMRFTRLNVGTDARNSVRSRLTDTRNPPGMLDRAFLRLAHGYALASLDDRSAPSELDRAVFELHASGDRTAWMEGVVGRADALRRYRNQAVIESFEEDAPKHYRDELVTLKGLNMDRDEITPPAGHG